VSGTEMYGKEWADCSADWHSVVGLLLAVRSVGLPEI